MDRNLTNDKIATLQSEVALLAEGVDRNNISLKFSAEDRDVALLAEGVDRNLPADRPEDTAACRPPRGGRG